MPSGLSKIWPTCVMSWRVAAADIRQRYRGSTLGPIWLTLTMLTTGASIAVVYSVIFKMPYQTYLSYVVVGMSIWAFINGAIFESTTGFSSVAPLIKNANVGFSMHILRVFFRHFIILLHNVAAVLIVLVFTTKVSLIGLAIGLLGAVAVGLALLPYGFLIALVGARYRDIAQMIGATLQFAMLITPIYWLASAAPGRGFVTRLNPFYYLVEAFRLPILGSPTPWMVYVVIAALGLGGALIAVPLFQANRRNIPFWV